MFELTEVLDGIADAAVDLPLIFARSHATLLGNAVAGPFLLTLRQKHEPRRYIRPRTLALLEVLVLYAASKALDVPKRGPAGFANNAYVEILKLGDAKLSDQVLAILFGLLVALYCVYYLALKLLRLRGGVHQVLVDGCLYYAMLTVFVFGVFVIIYLGAFNAAFSTANERILRTVLGVTYVACFLRIGLFVARTVDRRASRRLRLLEVATYSAVAFALFAVVVSVIVGMDALWPNLNM